jgi:hypothetical protein
MIVTDVVYVALSTIAVMVVLQIVTFMITRMMYPPEPKIIYRDVHVPVLQQQAPPPPILPAMTPPSLPQQQNGPVFTQSTNDIQLPEYEPRKPSTDSLRLDPQLPIGLQETRPSGT